MFFARKKRQAALAAAIDALGDVRTEMRRLKLQEEALRAEIESYRPGKYVIAGRYELSLQTRSKKWFNRHALPEHIREDPAYWKTLKLETMTITPLDSSQMAPAEGEIDDTYADIPIPDPTPGEADYGRRMSVDPDKRVPPPTADDLDWREAAEPAEPFDWGKRS
ncbi:hypothetical protein [Primorskyibacter sp. S187A]|uniref:hypothetical protein n=1 Tax=Primorskyibacter sp. S187A TaxID=3415130 RepID=UPI003C797B16